MIHLKSLNRLASVLNTDKCFSSALDASLAAGAAATAAALRWFYGDTRYQHRAGVAPPARQRHRIGGGICRSGKLSPAEDLSPVISA